MGQRKPKTRFAQTFFFTAEDAEDAEKNKKRERGFLIVEKVQNQAFYLGLESTQVAPK